MEPSTTTAVTPFFAERIREARKEAELSQGKLARAIGVSDRAVQNWEQGLRSPQVRTLTLIAAATGKPISFFFGETA